MILWVAGLIAGLLLLWLRRAASRRSLNYAGQTVVITGVDAGNVGFFTAISVAKTAEKVICVSIEKLSDTVTAQLRKEASAKFEFLVLDLTRDESVAQLAQRVTKVDLLCLFHTISARVDALDSSVIALLRKNMEVNFFSFVRLLQTFVPKLSTRGRIIVTSSVAGCVPMPLRTPYSSSKAALGMYVSCLAMEHPNLDIQIVYPGMIDTPAVHLEYTDEVIRKNALKAEDFVQRMLVTRGFKSFIPISGFLVHVAETIFPELIRKHLPKILPDEKCAEVDL